LRRPDRVALLPQNFVVISQTKFKASFLLDYSATGGLNVGEQFDGYHLKAWGW